MDVGRLGDGAGGGWTAPLYWRERDGAWFQFGPGGLAPLEPDAPVRHVSWYEADAFARWSQARLPTEVEWEAASANPAMHRNDRPCLAMDRKRLPALSGVPRGAGRDRRIQRKVHDQPDGAARRLAGHPGTVIRARPTGISSTPTNDGSSAAFVWQKTYNGRLMCQTILDLSRRRRGRTSLMTALAGLTATPRHCRRSCSMMTKAAGCSTRSPGCRSIT